MGETPFSLTYGTKAIILVDIYMCTLHMKDVDWDQNAFQVRPRKTNPKKGRDMPQSRLRPTNNKIKTAHHKKVKAREFQIGDLILKHFIQSTEEKMWESSELTGKGRTPWLQKEAKVSTP